MRRVDDPRKWVETEFIPAACVARNTRRGWMSRDIFSGPHRYLWKVNTIDKAGNVTRHAILADLVGSHEPRTPRPTPRK